MECLFAEHKVRDEVAKAVLEHGCESCDHFVRTFREEAVLGRFFLAKVVKAKLLPIDESEAEFCPELGHLLGAFVAAKAASSPTAGSCAEAPAKQPVPEPKDPNPLYINLHMPYYGASLLPLLLFVRSSPSAGCQSWKTENRFASGNH